MDAAGEDNSSAFGDALVAVNMLLALTVFLLSWFPAHQSLDDFRDEDNDFDSARVRLTAGQDAAE